MKILSFFRHFLSLTLFIQRSKRLVLIYPWTPHTSTPLSVSWTCISFSESGTTPFDTRSNKKGYLVQNPSPFSTSLEYGGKFKPLGTLFLHLRWEPTERDFRQKRVPSQEYGFVGQSLSTYVADPSTQSHWGRPKKN